MSQSSLPDGADPSLDLALRVDRVCNRYEAAWVEGRPRLEDYLGDWLEPGRSALLRELVALDAEYRRSRSETPRPTDYHSLFPDAPPAWLTDAVSGASDSAAETQFPLAEATPCVGSRDPALTETACGLSPPLSEPSAVPPELAGHPRYQVLALLGQGGMGAVYKAEHKRMERIVALKVIRPGYIGNAAAVRRFQQEVRAAARLHHPHIVAAYDADEAGGLHFLVMEYVEGQSIADYLREHGPLPAAEACDYARQAALGLQHAHEQGMVHRDVKPHNLMRTPDGQIKILDFGLARVGRAVEATATSPKSGVSASQLTGVGAIMGTADYIAPEQADDAHGADSRADIYSLGCTLYQLLAGRPPFARPHVQMTLAAHQEETPKPLSATRPDVPAALAAVLRRMMAKSPVDRYQTAAEVVAALAPFVAEDPLPPVPSIEPAPKRPRRLLAAIAAAALVVAALLAAAVVVRIQTPRGEVAIETDDPNIEVVVTKGGKIARIVDPQTHHAWELDPEKFEIGMADEPDGLTIALDGKQPFTLKRKGEKLVTITRRPPPNAPPVEEPAEVRRIAWINPAGPVNVINTAFSPDGRLYAAGGDDGRVRIWKASTGELTREITNAGWTWGLAFTPDGARLFCTETQATVPPQLFAVASGREIRRFPGHTSAVQSAAVSPDGKQAVTSGDDKTIRSWDLETGKELWRTEGPDHYTFPVVISHDGKLVLCPKDSNTLQVCDAGTGKRLRLLQGHTDAVICCQFTPDDKKAISVARDKTLRVWDVAGGKEIRRSNIAALADVNGMMGGAISRDARLLVTAHMDYTVRAFDVETGIGLCRFGTENRPQGVSISPDGRFAACGSFTGAAYLFRLPTPPADAP